MKNLPQFDTRDFLSIGTFRKTGVGVKSPIWFVELDGEFLMWADVSSGKISWIRNNPRVMVAPCKRFGDITGERVSAQAPVDDTPEAVEQVESLLRRKIGIGFALFRLIDKLRDRRKGGRRVCVTVSAPASSAPPRSCTCRALYSRSSPGRSASHCATPC